MPLFWNWLESLRKADSRKADLGSRTAVASALMRYEANGQIRQFLRGLYDWPRQHPLLGVLWPDVAMVAQALERKDGLRLQPAGAYAANMLGLSEQVPAQVVYQTDGPWREVAIGFRKCVLGLAPVAGGAGEGFLGVVAAGAAVQRAAFLFAVTSA
jgi:hypothetical protein